MGAGVADGREAGRGLRGAVAAGDGPGVTDGAEAGLAAGAATGFCVAGLVGVLRGLAGAEAGRAIGAGAFGGGAVLAPGAFRGAA